MLYNRGMFIVLLFICAALCSLLVYPLWLFATTQALAYSITVGSLLVLALVFFCVTRIKKHGAKSSLRVILHVLTVIFALSLAALFVLNKQRVFALLSLIGASALFFLISRALKPTARELSSEND